MALSDAALRGAKPLDKQYKLHDSGGLFVIVRRTGAKLWRLKYRFNGIERQLSIGTYPTVGLKDARERRENAKKLLENGIDPSAEKRRDAVAKVVSSAKTFDVVAAEFISKRVSEGIAPATLAKANWFVALLRPAIGKRPVSEIEPYEILDLLKMLDRKGNHVTAKRLRAFADRVFRFAIISNYAKQNPATALGEALVKSKVTHHAAILDPKGFGALLRAIDGYQGNITTRLALSLAPHVFARPGELRHAEWTEIDLDNAVWRIPAAKMKMREEHVIPLSRQALDILKRAGEVRGNSKYVFPAVRTWLRPMSENTLNAALRRLGYTGEEMTSHGFRTTASTLLNESRKWSADAIERALAHKDKNEVRGIYHRGSHWNERVEMAQWWSDHLDELKTETSK